MALLNAMKYPRRYSLLSFPKNHACDEATKTKRKMAVTLMFCLYRFSLLMISLRVRESEF